MKKRDVSGKQRQAAKDILVEAGIMGNVKQELELTKALQKKKVDTILKFQCTLWIFNDS